MAPKARCVDQPLKSDRPIGSVGEFEVEDRGVGGQGCGRHAARLQPQLLGFRFENGPIMFLHPTLEVEFDFLARKGEQGASHEHVTEESAFPGDALVNSERRVESAYGVRNEILSMVRYHNRTEEKTTRGSTRAGLPQCPHQGQQ